MNKLSKRQKPKLSKRQNREDLISLMKEKVKKDTAVIKKFKQYKVPLEDLDKVEIHFAPLDVSAKTKDMKIYINESMLDDDSEVKDPASYLAHEIVHWLQQKTHNTAGHDVPEYLDKPTEIESFKTQIKYKKEHDGEDEAKEYTEDLLDYHNITGPKREKKKRELLGNDK